ncbi:MAG: nucleotidyltransferase [Saprospiraceae bacterium]|nr:nucleotidyltransferase [Saprospiraceae bacterium]
MAQPSLLILAAGMGSRYGGLKQMDSFGPGGQTIIDFSIYDAVLAGFEEIVFVIRRSFADAFIAQMDQKWSAKVRLKYVFQETDELPDLDFTIPERSKPWGTAHAVWVARNEIAGPFGVINADDFYGREALMVLYQILKNSNHYALIAYPIVDTLSENGSVNRGVCKVDSNKRLIEIKECRNIQSSPVISFTEHGKETILDEGTLVSMNMWALQSDFFCWSELYFIDFLKSNGQDAASEFYIPDVIQRLMHEQNKLIDVVPSGSKWYGVTYQEDKPAVETAFLKMIEQGLYPAKF